MKITPQQRIEAYKLLGVITSKDHEYFMESLFAIAEQLNSSAKRAVIVSRPQRSLKQQRKIIRKLHEIAPFIENEPLDEAVTAYEAEREKVLDFLMGQSPKLKTNKRKLNEVMQELLSQISQEIVRNQTP